LLEDLPANISSMVAIDYPKANVDAFPCSSM
jgi:hypothetical protein